ncbi:jg2923 [Pararge aegeria aegeria]|uniref:Jg2923 protein n=1 Tax=Pararge aegeria aegeria TaxID=348720 RepID=A0A8S4SKI3_9NEOP|nr:jg2923 [Pararge aegeria aegeria]
MTGVPEWETGVEPTGHSAFFLTLRFFDHVQKAVDSVLEQIPTAEVVILGDSNAHHVDWLGSRTTDHAGRSAYNFVLAYDLSQLVSVPTRVPDIEDHSPSLLDLFLTSPPADYDISVDAPLGSSDHCLVQTSVQPMNTVRSRVSDTRRVAL